MYLQIMTNAITAYSDPRTLIENTLVPIHLHIEGCAHWGMLMMRRRSYGYSAKTQPKGWEVVWAGRTPKGWTRNYTHKCKTEAEAREFAEKKFGDVIGWVQRMDEKAAA